MDVSKLSYKDLQKELKKRGVKANGKKAALLNRLKDVVAKETSSSTSTEKKVEQNPPPPSPKPKPKKKSEDVVRKRGRSRSSSSGEAPTKKRNKKTAKKNVAEKINTNKPTVNQIRQAPLTKKAEKHWKHGKSSKYSSKVVREIYFDDLQRGSCAPSQIALLEFSQYLESYLWPNFSSKNATLPSMMSIVYMINRKASERVPVFEFLGIESGAASFRDFFQSIVSLITTQQDSEKTKLIQVERTALMRFLVVCFNSFENSNVRSCVAPLVHLPMWKRVSKSRRDLEFADAPELKKHWKNENIESMSDDDSRVSFLYSIFQNFLEIVETDSDSSTMLRYCERVVELTIDLLSQLRTRRFLHVLLDDMHFCVRGSMSKFVKSNGLLCELLRRAEYYLDFEIDDITGEALSETRMEARHYDRISRLQRVLFEKIESGELEKSLQDLVMSHVSGISSRERVCEMIRDSNCDVNRLSQVMGIPISSSPELTLEALSRRFQKRQSQIRKINEYSLYPDESLLWDENLVPEGRYENDAVLALPKLNLQFLTVHDYLLRSFNLYRLEACYEIRDDVRRAVKHLKPVRDRLKGTVFSGWSRMAVPLESFELIEVSRARLGETRPERVRGEIKFSLSNYRGEIRDEWAAFKQHDIVFLLTVRASASSSSSSGDDIAKSSVITIRGAEITQVLDEDNVVINELGGKPDLRPGGAVGSKRTLRVLLDPSQYARDVRDHAAGKTDVYDTFNILLRRNPKENNFKAVLETIRDLMNCESVVNSAVPKWLHDIFLGYGNPASASSIHHVDNPHLPSALAVLKMKDTFLDAEHVTESFQSDDVEVKFADKNVQPPFRLRFVNSPKTKKLARVEVSHYDDKRFLHAARRNHVRFTPKQIEAVRSGMNPGLTMIVGPPGTGKTDVAVQIVSNLYHNFPNQRTILVTHSNQALNDLFEKIMDRDIDERHLIRLGAGSKRLDTVKDFSKWGRVNMTLKRRIELLGKVKELASSLNDDRIVADDVAYTCETSAYFELHHVTSRIEKFELDLKNTENTKDVVADMFPFVSYLKDKENLSFKRVSYEQDLAVAREGIRRLKALFEELRDYRAFELLRSGRQRSDYMLAKQARIIAMTCTHASLVRRHLIDLDFKFDNIVMEEAAQMLEIETFVPMLLQSEANRLKRVVLIGDHNQLPPVVKNEAFKRFGHLDQSLFARFVRLGTPTIELDRQGRSRPCISALYRWRYDRLGDLTKVVTRNEYALANAGFAHEFQLVNVEDLNGQGENQPTPYFYQNLAEAEYIVSTYQYMRLIGYPKERIVILTTYRGQKHLIRDVLRRRCASQPELFGWPSKVATVDKYQGQQNDFVLLSLVRTKSVGHVRDVRRLVVAMSRARLGLYIFCRVNLMSNCYELRHVFEQLKGRDTRLGLVSGENYGTVTRKAEETVDESKVFRVNNLSHMAALLRQMVG